MEKILANSRFFISPLWHSKLFMHNSRLEVVSHKSDHKSVDLTAPTTTNIAKKWISLLYWLHKNTAEVNVYYSLKAFLFSVWLGISYSIITWMYDMLLIRPLRSYYFRWHVFVTMWPCLSVSNITGQRWQLSGWNVQHTRAVAPESCYLIRQVAAPCSAVRDEIIIIWRDIKKHIWRHIKRAVT